MPNEGNISRKEQARQPGTYGVIALAFLSVAVIIGLVVTFAGSERAITDLRFNPFAVVSFVAVLANLAVLVSLLRLRPRTDASIWFGAYVSGVTFFGISEMFQRLSANPSGGLFWGQLSAIGITMAPLSLFMFASSYAGKLKQNLPLIPVFIITACVVIFFNANSGIIFTTDPSTQHLWPWGFNDAIGPGFIFHASWISILDGTAIYILLRTYASTKEVLLKKQALVFSLAVAIPWAAATISDGILPLFGVTLMPIAVTTTTLTGIIILFGIKRYHLFRIDQELLSESILTTMKEAVIVTRPDFGIDMFNNEAQALLGGGDITSRHLSTFFSEAAWQEMHHKHLNQLEGNGSESGYQTHLLGSNTPVRIVVSTLKEFGAIAGYIFVISDITELAESYEKLEEEKQNVEHIVEVRTEALRKAHEELQASDKLKTEFMMIASHNLRTPLTVINGYLGMIKEKAAKSPELLELLASIEAHSRRLSMFAEDLLIISSIEAGEKIFANEDYFPVDPFIRGIATDFEIIAKEKNIRLAIELGPMQGEIFGSRLHVRSAIWNILDNALKFTDSGGTITFQAAVENAKLHIRVKDTGVGISSEEMDKLFTKFHRGTDTLTYNYEGRGIGLYVTKLIITQHKGSIDVRSQLGQGTTIDINLPTATRPADDHSSLHSAQLA